jgi:hypothetical protein
MEPLLPVDMTPTEMEVVLNALKQYSQNIKTSTLDCQVAQKVSAKITSQVNAYFRNR